MSIDIDSQSMVVLRSVIGKELLHMLGRRYPGVAGYSELRLVEKNGRTLALRQRIVDVEDLEV